MIFRKLFGLSAAAAPQVNNDEWKTDAQLRRFAFSEGVRKDELMADDFREFFMALDEYNLTADDDKKVRIEIRRELGQFLQGFIDGVTARSPYGGLAQADGMRVHVGRTVYEAVYFNDMVLNTGLSLYLPGAEKKSGSFLFGLTRGLDFGGVVRNLAVPEQKQRRGWFSGPR